MVFKLLEKVLRAGEGKKLKVLQDKMEAVNSLEAEVSRLSDEELKGKTSKFRERLQAGETLDDLLPETFAVVREVAKRILNMRHFDVQIMGGIVLHEGKIAEMATGEGKTLVATLPVYLNALEEKGVHLVTVNDYLAKRDTQWMGPIYHFLGLSVSVLQHEAAYLYDPAYSQEDESLKDLRPVERREAYLADVTYGTNNEFGFDYLRDNMVVRLEDRVQRSHHYAIVDEVDSILIDEARTPLIISGPAEESTDKYYLVDKIIPYLRKEKDYQVDEKLRTASLTEEGVSKAEKLLKVKNLYDPRNMDLAHHVVQALKAHTLFKRDVEYMCKDGEVIIVDEFTGRLMPGRRYSEGLHQAIEAKEGVTIREENQTLATITIQNYFRMYEKLAGMTGTAATEADEFEHIYGLGVVVIPTNKPLIRKMLSDVIYKTEESKFGAVVDDIAERHGRGQPVLVGTISIEKSERLSKMLRKRGVSHQVLNAKYHEMEAHIIAQAGRKGAVTIATNMAGRGVDIILGGNPPDAKEAEGIKALGGLHVLGTERHEARRIDNQLRGRSGRQGDPGSSQFYLSLEDDLMRLFGSDRVSRMMERLGVPDDMPIEHSMVSKSIETAQRQVESQNFELRKHVLEYDDVINKQREVIYEQRTRCLEERDLRDRVLGIMEDIMREAVENFTDKGTYPEEWDLDSLFKYVTQFYPVSWGREDLDLSTLTQEELLERLRGSIQDAYEKKEKELGSEMMRELERLVMLQVVDERWREHLRDMDYLREGIGLRAIGQKDPLVEYKREAYAMWQKVMDDIREDFVKFIFHARFVEEPARPQLKVVAGGGSEIAASPQRRGKKVGRNDPCPCGSGKKYKKCCGR